MTDLQSQCVACGAVVAQDRCEKCGAVTRAGGYRVLSVLAQTPHSRTYVAENAEGRKVALKELLFAAVPTVQQLEAFDREGRLLRQLDHPRIPKFLDLFKEGEGTGTRFYLAQELVEGESLWQRLRAGVFDEPQVRELAAQVLDVLAYLHGRTPRVIHRDVKPHNLIARPDGSVALVDFGAARELTEGVTHQATLVGTYGYMPPDQLAGTVDPTCDLYALGASAMHLLTGRPPEKLVGDDLELGAGISLNVSPDFERFVRKLAARVAARRFPTAEAAIAALKALPPAQFRRGIRLKRTWVAAAAGVVALAGITTGVVLMNRAPAATAAPVPGVSIAPPVKVWVWEPKVPVFEAANPASALQGQTLSIGTELMVDRPPNCGPFLRLQSPPLTGFVRESDVRSSPPRYEEVLESSRKALGEAALPATETEGERAHALRPKEREPLALLQALYNAEHRPDDARRVHDLLSALGAAPPAAPAKVDTRSGSNPKPEETWYIGASSLRMRNKPSAEGKVLADLDINTDVQVVAMKGDWAEVNWVRPARAREIDLGGNGTVTDTAVAEETVKGFVAQAYLVRELVDKDWTLAKAADAEKRGDAAEAERQLARASAVDPVNRPLQLRLAKAAVATRDYPVAANAAVAANELARGASEPLVELKLAYRCRGDLNRAEWLDDSTDPAHMPEDACIESLSLPECSSCECGDSSYEYEHPQELMRECEANGKEDPNETEGDLHAACERKVDEQMRQEREEASQRPDPNAAYYARESARTARRSDIDGAFTDQQSWLRIKVTGPARTSPDANRVVVYSFSTEVTREQECAATDPEPAGGCPCESAQAHVNAVEAMAMPAPGEDATLWVRVPAFEDHTYGVAFGKSASAVAGELERRYSSCGAGEPERTISVSTETNCEECNCT